MALIQGVVDGFIMTVGITPPKPENNVRPQSSSRRVFLVRLSESSRYLRLFCRDASPLISRLIHPYCRKDRKYE